MDNAKARQTGNWWCLNLNETSDELVRISEIWGMSADCPSLSPPSSHTSRTWLPICVMTIQVPLHNLWPGERLWSKMTGHPTLRFNSPGGRLEELTEQRNSVRVGSSSHGSAPGSQIISSALMYWQLSPAMRSKISWLISPTSTFWGARIMQLRKYSGGGGGVESMAG